MCEQYPPLSLGHDDEGDSDDDEDIPANQDVTTTAKRHLSA